MPHCSTMCRASRVAFWRSLVAPDVTCRRAAELCLVTCSFKDFTIEISLSLQSLLSLKQENGLGQLQEESRPNDRATVDMQHRHGMKALASSLVGTHDEIFRPCPAAWSNAHHPTNS